jgi:hypothetical protein
VLTNLETILRLPLPPAVLANQSWLGDLLGEADAGIKKYCKRDLEMTSYVEYHDGHNTPEVIARQYPIWVAQTSISALSNGASLPVSTLNVTSTKGFPPGTGGNPNAQPPSLCVQTGLSTYATVTYTGTTATSFTGCQGGTGTLTSQLGQSTVGTPCVYFNETGYYGQAPPNATGIPSGFSDGNLMVLGSQFAVEVDDGRGQRSDRGLILKLGGVGVGFPGFYRETLYSGKLAAYRLPCWPRGYGNIKVAYTAGYFPIPFDLVNACVQMVAWLSRSQPLGGVLTSENLGGYSYSILTNPDANSKPELGSIIQTLTRYRETSW